MVSTNTVQKNLRKQVDSVCKYLLDATQFEHNMEMKMDQSLLFYAKTMSCTKNLVILGGNIWCVCNGSECQAWFRALEI